MRYDGFRHELQCGGDTITFDAKPPNDVLSALKANGFRWNPQQQTWWRRRSRPYADLLAWIDRKLHPDRPDGDCRKCGQLGKRRQYAAHTLLLCNDCWETYLAECNQNFGPAVKGVQDATV